MKNTSKILANLVSNEGGNVMMTFGLTSMIAIAAVGGAVDFGRSYQMKSKMQNALDAAVVSGVAKYRETNNWTAAKSNAQSVFQAMFTNAVSPTQQNPNPTPGLDQPLVNFTQSGTQLSGTASMTTNTPFMNLVIGHNLSISATSNGVPPNGKMLEVAMMVDLTGSMGWDAATGASSTPCGTITSPHSKIDYLKCAGEDILNILLPASGANNNSVKIGVAPFADYVNAGPYADEVTGLAASGGSYANITNLASTKQGSFTGSYSGYTPTSGGSQFGSTGASVPSGGTNSGGGTYNNAYCSSPTSTTTIGIVTYYGYRTGIRIDREDGMNDAVTGLIYISSNASNSDKFKKITEADGDGSNWIDYDDGVSTGYFAPRPVSTTGLTIRTRTASWNGSNKTGNIGAYAATDGSVNEGNMLSMGFKKATSSTGYWKLTKVKDSGNHEYSWTTSGYYLPIYESLTTTSTTVGCEAAVASQPSSHLISCVTERLSGSSLDYTDDTPGSGKYVGAYNHGVTSKSNYSSDGKCWVGGRELPAVIPLTNDRTTLTSFFSSATVGGATPGHLGTAWASYLLSPNWSSIWPTSSAPAAYTNTGVIKAAILMTDGEYNLQFSTGGSSTNTSAKQALMLCKAMRDRGIRVYTIGFGFAANATPPTTNIEGMSDSDRTTPAGNSQTARALDTLAKCASTNASYYFPYDGESLRQAFKSIGNSLSASISGGNARLTN